MYVSAFTTPELDSDLDDFIQKNRNEKIEDLWNDVKQLISEKKFLPRNVDELINDIKNIRCKNGQNKNLREFEINQKIAEIVIDDLNMRGEFYRNESEVFFFDKVRKHLCKISSGDLECKLLLDNLGLNRSERLFNYISEAIHAFGYKNGKVTKIHTTSFYDSTNNISYLYNHDSQIYRITPNSVDLVDNGTDGILFLQKQKTDPFKFLEFDNNQTFSWLDRDFISDINFDTSSNSVEDVQLLLKVWLYALFFESIMPTKPILTFIGPKGSGKSFVQRLIGIILFGRYFNVTPVEHNQKDFDAAVSNSYYMVLDNVENSPTWLQDRLAVLSTGGTLRKRLYYTTNEEIDISLRCFLAINAIERLCCIIQLSVIYLAAIARISRSPYNF
ncbi:MAG: hypothetical protein H6629_05640 [Calditrichae bacterium]|nr:hypothetical protein [Calditrichia bacterium]